MITSIPPQEGFASLVGNISTYLSSGVRTSERVQLLIWKTEPCLTAIAAPTSSEEA